VQLTERFDAQNQSINNYLCFENALLTGHMAADVKDVLKTYPELDVDRLSVQLAIFKMNNKCSTLAEAKQAVQAMLAAMRSMFIEEESHPLNAIVSCIFLRGAECSFSALRWLKTWLRSTMSQERMNSVAVCHVNQDVIDTLNDFAIEADFASRSDTRQSIFTHGPY
jgi:hypothetical protein